MSLRRLLAGLGRTLITAGVLLLLFVAYQLWGTGIAEARDQRKGLKTFEAQLAELGLTPLAADGSTSASGAPSVDSSPGATTPPTPAAATPPTTAPPATSSATTALPTIGAADNPVVDTDPSTVTEPTAAPATARPASTTSTLPQVRAGRSQAQKPKAGNVLGLMVIPRIHVRKVMVEGSDEESLKTGPGHYSSTPFPGQPGNVGVACHRTTYGAPCFNLDLLAKGDLLFFQTKQGSFRYEVERSWKVSPKDTKVLAPTAGENVITLTTCDPKYSAQRRLIVRARLVGPAADSDFFEEPVPATTTPPATTPPTAAPATLPPTTLAPVPSSAVGSLVPTTALPATTIPATTTPTATTPISSSTIAASGTDAAALTAHSDPVGSGPVWSIGWLRGHRSTWIATLEWAFGCSLIWLLAWRLARRRRLPARILVYGLGFVILFVPALYFCFENLARLLPENL